MSKIQEIAERFGVNTGTVQRSYKVWLCMVQRCHLPTSTSYHKYGARGVTVCKRWRESFEAFVEDMGFRDSSFTVDRIDNGKGYNPDNCRWMTHKEQQRNRTNNVIVEHEGERFCIAELAERSTIGESVLRQRLSRGWDVDRAVSTPVQQQNYKRERTGVKVEHLDREWTVGDLAEIARVSVSTLRYRLKKGWPIKRALMAPAGFPPPHRSLKVEPVI